MISCKCVIRVLCGAFRFYVDEKGNGAEFHVTSLVAESIKDGKVNDGIYLPASEHLLRGLGIKTNKI